MTRLLLFEAFLQGFHDFFPAAQFLDLVFFFLAKQSFSFLSQPLFGDFADDFVERGLHAVDVVTEHLVKAIEMSFVFHQAQSGKVIKLIDAVVSDTGV